MPRTFRSLVSRALAAVSAAAIAACSSNNPTSGGTQAASVTVDPASASIVAGDSVPLAATAKDARGNVLANASFTWTSSDTDATPVSASGVVTSFLASVDTITATTDGVSGSAVLTVAAPPSIALHEGGLIGTVSYANGDSAAGGQGSAVDTIPCGTGADAEHYHVHLSLFVDGQQVAIPYAIGIMNPVLRGDSIAIAGTCFYWLHSHDRTGIIHVEPEQTGHTFTLGEYFDIWGEPLTSGNVAGHTGAVTVYVNGARYVGDPRAITLTAYEQITLEVGARVAPPVYTFPPGY